MFWKEDLARHPLAVETLAIAADPNETRDRKAVCSNLWHDHRVPPARAQRFLDEASRHQTEPVDPPRDIIDCLRHHYENRIKTREHPEFSDPRYIGENEPKDLNPYLRLCNVLNLSKLFDPLRKGLSSKPEYEEVFQGFPENESGYPDWIDGKMKQLDVRTTLEAIFEVLAAQNRKSRWQPTWVVPWKSFEPYLEEPADRWLEVLGMQPSPNSWLACLQYRIRDIARLLRPTQIDAGFSYCHFPSPPMIPSREGGHPMDLRHPCAKKKFVSEFIHRQIGYDIRFWDDIHISGRRLAAHEKLKKTSAARPTPKHNLSDYLATRRSQHWSRLVIQYPAETHHWMGPAYL